MSPHLRDPARLQVLHSTALLDTPPEEAFDRLTRLAARFLAAPVALVSLLDAERQYIKSSVGVGGTWEARRELPLEYSFSRQLLGGSEPLVVPDAREHPQLCASPTITRLGLHAYLGVPLTCAGQVVGAFAVLDRRPRAWTADDVAVLEDLAAAARAEIELRRTVREQERAAAALRESEERYRSVFLGAQEALFLVERAADGYRYVDANPRIGEITGIPCERWVGARPHEVLPPAAAARAVALFEQVFRSGETFSTEYTNTLPRGDVTTRTRLCPLPGPDGKVARLVCISEDVTGRVQAERALRESEARYRQIFAESRDGLFVTERDGTVVDANPALLELLGCAHGELFGSNATDSYAHAAERERFRRTIETAGFVRDFETQLRRQDGALVDVLLTATVRRAADGTLLGYQGLVHDVTGRKHAEAARQEVLERYDLVQRATNDTIWDWDPCAGSLTWNEGLTRMFGYGPSPMRTDLAWWTGRLHPDDHARVSAHFEQALAREESWRDEYRFRKADGTYAVVLDRALIQRDQAGQVVRAIGSMQDVTERVHDKQRLEESATEAQLHLARLQAVLRALPVGVFITDAAGVVEVSNPAAQEIWGGHTPKVGIDAYGAYRARKAETGELLGTEEWPIARAIRTGRSVLEEELAIEAFDGTLRTVLASGLLIRDDGGQVLGGIAVNVDVTARRRAEQALRESEAKFRSLIENASDVISILDAEGCVRYESPAVERMLGYRSEELRGQPFAAFVHPDDAAHIARIFERVLGSPGEPVPYAMRFRHADGSYRRLDGIATNFLHDPAVGGIVANSRDVSEQTAAEEALRASNEMLQALFDAAPLPIAVLTPEGVVESWNPATERTFGWSAAEAIGGPLPFLTAELREEHERMRRRALEGDGFTGVELQRRRKDGTPVHVSLSAAPVRDPDGSVRRLVWINEDITERVFAAERLEAYARELERSNRELQDFAYVASHDLQEPLRKIQAFGDRLRDRFAPALGAQGDDYLQRMQDAARRMQQLIQDLLAFSRVGSKAAPFAQVDVGQVVREVAVDLESRLHATGGQLRCGELPVLEADALQLRQLVQNLVGNALKYHRPGVPPVVEVAARELPRTGRAGSERVELRVTDNGIGFEPQYAERIFAPFQRLHGRGEYEGTGMGLAICRKIVERHGGSISAESTPGAGSTFVVVLPRKQRTTGEFA